MVAGETNAGALDGEVELVGRIRQASNATFVARIDGVRVVYKPVAGERPLWDFPDGTLARREVAAHALSASFGWDLVPRTWLRDGPLGPGMVQVWCEPDPAQDPVDLVPADAVPEGWLHVFDGFDADDRVVSLIHEDTAALRRMAVFDIVANNADRKGGHVLPTAAGHRYGVDHGLTFHTEPKLRTVLWGWLGRDLDADELAGLERVRADLDSDLRETFADLLAPDEVTATIERCEDLLAEPRFPGPRGEMPAVPWPPF
ncbi:SCO1664 family protein [Occultella glacieicola]|uniref:SCO1664 family protein n=1 Tax=Occultella glacieicola TaxID=2518684 RepID=A0ABY2E546_9MICO|nr:SCO1664 family protein [Occultella glacieicola]